MSIVRDSVAIIKFSHRKSVFKVANLVAQMRDERAIPRGINRSQGNFSSIKYLPSPLNAFATGVKKLSQMAIGITFIALALALVNTSVVHAESTKSATEMIDKMSPEVEVREGEVLNNVEQWGTGRQHWEKYRGATSGEVSQAHSTDTQKAIKNFISCQDKDNQHNLYQIWSPANVQTGNCYEYHAYSYFGGGHMTGLCLRIISIPPWCWLYFIWADLVEYYYPAYKLDVSEQMFQSRYVSTGEVSGALSSLESVLKDVPASVASTLDLVAQKSSGSLMPGGLGSSDGADGITKVADNAYKAISQYRSAHPDAGFSAPHLFKQYSRNTFEILNTMTGPPFGMAMFRQIPHLPHTHYFYTDMPLGYRYAKLLNYSKTFAQKYGLMFLVPTGERACIRDNIASGKTTRGSIGDFEMFSMRSEKLCVKNVGEIYAFTDNRRPHITDASFQGAQKNIDMYQGDDSLLAMLLRRISKGIWGMGTPHTYVRKVDKWNVIYNPIFEQENNKKCDPVDSMARVHTSYDKSNIKETRKGGENSFEIYPMFKGCWDFKGDDRGWIVMDVGSGKIPRGKLRIE